MALTYLDFELQVERDGDQYRAEVLRSPVGEASGLFQWPFSAEGLENLILKLATRRGRTRSSFNSEVLAARELGGRLFEAVFTGDIRACLRRSLDAAESQPGVGLRIKLRIQSAGEIADLPWEFLYDASQGAFLAQSNYTPLVRYIELPQRIRPLGVSLPLRILIMISAPNDPDYATLDVQHERRRVEDALAPLLATGKVEIDWLEHATLAALRQALRSNTYHAFHFIGHGGFDRAAGEGMLILEDEHQRGQRAGAHRIGPLLHDHRSLRLAVLNACEGARNSRDDPFSGIATSLIRQGIPAVVAMQFEITDAAAITFAHGFYSAIAEGYPVDLAVADARSAILVQPNDIEWATPVLYMRSPDGLLFDVGTADVLVPAVETVADEASPEEAAPATDEALDAIVAAGGTPPQPLPVDGEGLPADSEAPSPSAGAAADTTMPSPAEPADEVAPTVATVSLELERRGGGFPGLSGAGRYRLLASNPNDAPEQLHLKTDVDAPGYHSSLPGAVWLEPGETKELDFEITPDRRRWRGPSIAVPFRVIGDGEGTPPAPPVEASFEDRPRRLLPYAGGSLLGLGAIAAAFALLSGGNGDSRLAPEAAATLGAVLSDLASAAPSVPSGATGGSAALVPPGGTDVIFFSSNRARSAANHDVYSIRLDTRELSRLTDGLANDHSPAATFSGSHVAFVSDRSGNDEIFVMRGDGSEQTRVTDEEFPNSEPDLTPDGSTVLYERRVSDTVYQIFLGYNGTFTSMVLSPGSNIDPDWAPDGLRFAFASDRDGDIEVYATNAGGAHVRLTHEPGNDVEPNWSPDGSRIVFESNRKGNADIFMVNADGTDERQLTFHAANDQDPVFSPDGLKIAFETNRDGNWEIYILDLVTGEETNLTNNPAEDRKPAWALAP